VGKALNLVQVTVKELVCDGEVEQRHCLLNVEVESVFEIGDQLESGNETAFYDGVHHLLANINGLISD